MAGAFANAGRIREHAGRSTRIGGMPEGGGSGTATGPEPGGAQGPSASCDVFVSYASQDAAVANAIVAALERQGLKCWIAPRDVVPGSLYADGIVRAITGAKVFALVLSEHAIASSHVGKEIERASSNRRPIIALRTDLAPLTPAFQYFLSESQWIDVGTGGMDAASAKLVEAIQRHLTPQPAVERGAPPDRQTVARKSAVPRKAWLTAAAVAVVAVALAYFVFEKFGVSKRAASERPIATVAPVAAPATPAISDKSVAVLPFVDMSEKKDQEYFADGMAEEILDLLAKIPAIKVIGRTSSFQFKGKNEDLRTIGRQLGAAYVLEGSVRKAGNRVRITAQLIGTQDGVHRWSQTYERDVVDVLKLQDEIAGGIARALQVTVGATDLQPRPVLPNPEAYDVYLQGKYAFDRADEDGFAGAADHFQQAIDIDPTFADAAAWLAYTKMMQAELESVVPGAAFEQGRHAAEMALHLNPKLALAHVALAERHFVYDWDWEGAEKELKQALALQPRDAIALLESAELALSLGHMDEAVRLANNSLAVDPYSPLAQFSLGYIRWHSGHLAEAEAALRRCLQISPSFSNGHSWLAIVLLARGELDAALTEVQLETNESAKLEGLALVYFGMGRTANANQALEAFTNKFANTAAFPIAEVHGFRRENDLAFMWLERAYTQKDTSLFAVKGHPLLKSLEGDPRYKAFLRKMNLPD
jgi:TolB-like protein/Flp pilus assembly protein TadD